MSEKKILLVMTGGTICSFKNENGEKASDTKKAQALIIDKFRSGDCIYRSKEDVDFTVERPLDTLSENMSISKLNLLISALKSYDYSQYDAVIILHGTDTLAYTSSLLSLLLAGIKIPVFLVSSQLSLDEEAANGNDNFRTAVELVFCGIAPNVYVPYRNDEYHSGKETHKMYLHIASHLLQCENYSNNFFSKDMLELSETPAKAQGVRCKEGEMLLKHIAKLSNGVVKIEPYSGLDYSIFNLDAIKAVVHGTYHSSTVCTDFEEDEQCSVIGFIEKCSKMSPEIPVFIQPCNKNSYTYETTGKALRAGAVPIGGMTGECAYVKVLLGVSLGFEGEMLENFVNSEINGESVY